MKLTLNRMVLLRELSSGPKSWRDLREVYYGDPERIASSSSTSFCNQLHKLIDLCLIDKADGFYSITQLGKELIAGGDPDVVAAAKTEARIAAELRKLLGR